MHGHAEPVTRLLTAHLIHPIRNLPDAVEIPHGGQDAEEQTEVECQVLVDGPDPSLLSSSFADSKAVRERPGR